MSKATVAALALFLCAAEPGCSSDADEGAPDRPNVLLVSLDTLRADRLGAYGYERQTSPRLDALARNGALFEFAVAESPWTLPSHVTMLSGLHPASHRVATPTEKASADTPLLAEVLREAGYATMAFTEGTFMGERHGFDRGFDAFHEDMPSLSVSLEGAAELLEQRDAGRPFFLFLHTIDIHCPYDPPNDYARRFVSSDSEYVETEGKCGHPFFNSLDLSEGQVRHISDQYDAGIRSVDDLLGDFFDLLGSRGLLENTLVVITSDHGEELREHGQIGHGTALFGESLLVPLVFHGPGVPTVRVAEPVGLTDVVPTVLDLIGLPPPGLIDGRSLRPLFETPGEVAEDAYRISEVRWKARLRSVWTPESHMIIEPKTGKVKLFDLRVDPREQEAFTGEAATALAERMLERLAEHRAAMEATGVRTPVDIGQASPEEQARMRALGYAE